MKLAARHWRARSGCADGAAEAIHIENLHKKFGQLQVLKGVSLSARDGDVVAIIGGSGSGKSTLLRCINCLENPTSGIDPRQWRGDHG